MNLSFTVSFLNMTLSIDELATNAQTWDHIDLVQRLLACLQVELIKRSVSHDRSKLVPPEVSTFVEFTPKLKASTYGSPEYKQFLVDMKPALDNHYANNRHHPEHFPNGVNDMNLIDLLEMITDWFCASRRHADGDPYKSLEHNTGRFGLEPQLVQLLANTIPVLQSFMESDIVTLRSQAGLYSSTLTKNS